MELPEVIDKSLNKYFTEEPSRYLKKKNRYSIIRFIINTEDDLVEMYKGRSIWNFKGEYVDGIGYFEYHECLYQEMI